MSDIQHLGYRIRVVVEQVVGQDVEQAQIIEHAEKAWRISSAEFSSALYNPGKTIADLSRRARGRQTLIR